VTFVKFRMGDAFPANDVLSEWIATLALAFNDLSLVATRYLEDVDSAYKVFYWNRLLISHFAEAALYLHRTKDIDEIAEFVTSLPDGVQENYRAALRAFEARERELHAIRSHVFHYPELRIVPGQKRLRLMQRVLQGHADTETMMKLGKVSEARLLFADDMAAEVLQINSGGEEKLTEVMRQSRKRPRRLRGSSTPPSRSTSSVETRTAFSSRVSSRLTQTTGRRDGKTLESNGGEWPRNVPGGNVGNGFSQLARRLTATGGERPGSLDKLGVTGSSPVPPTTKAPLRWSFRSFPKGGVALLAGG
jgi:hypothetical protein